MNRFLILVVFTLLTFSVWSQKLNIGDRLPDSVWKASGVIEPNKYKLTVLDFWSHSCSSCIASFPKINQLKQIFGDSINIVLVNRESADSTARLFELRDWITRPQVPMISSDKSIQGHFEFWGLPFVVWLDSNLTVVGTSGGRQFKEINVRKFLRGEEFEGDRYGPIKRISSLFEKQYENNLLSFSYLARSQERVNIGSLADGSKLQQDIALSKYTMEMLFRYAYEENGKHSFFRGWQMQIGNVLLTDNGLEEDGGLKGVYDYALKLPEKDRNNHFKRMREDLDRYFNVISYVDTVPMRTAVLVKSTDTVKIQSKGGAPKNTFRSNSRHSGSMRVLGEDERVLINQPYERFSRSIKNLVERYLEMPFVDETNIAGNVDVSFDYLVFEFFSRGLLEEALTKNGLRIEERITSVPVLIIESQ